MPFEGAPRSLLSLQERPERARRRLAREPAAVEVLGQLPLDVVGEPPAVRGDKAPGLALDAMLTRTFERRGDAREKASNNTLGRARRRIGRAAGSGQAANVEVFP